MREISTDEKEVIEEIRCITGLEEGQIIQVFESFANIYSVGNVMDKKKIFIPFLGDIYIRVEDDIIVDDHREAVVRGFFMPSEILKKNLGYYRDFKQSHEKDDLHKMPAYKYLHNKIETSLKKGK